MTSTPMARLDAEIGGAGRRPPAQPVTDHQHASLLTGYRPRRAPQPPRIDPADRPPDAEVERQRQASRRRWQWLVRSR